MQAAIGDRFCVRGNIVGQPERTGEIIEVRGAGGEPPCLVRFADGHTSLVFPARTQSLGIRAGRVTRGRRKADSFCGVPAQPTQSDARSCRSRCADAKAARYQRSQ